LRLKINGADVFVDASAVTGRDERQVWQSGPVAARLGWSQTETRKGRKADAIQSP
jgi:hypothetical protein